MGLSADIRAKLINSFKTEQKERVQKINQGLLALEKKPNAQKQQGLLDEIFREAHSLKGSARAVGMTAIETLGHGLEDLLLHAREGRLTFSPELFDLLYQALDAVELLMTRVEAGNSTPPAKVLTLMAKLEEVTIEATEKSKNRKQESDTSSIKVEKLKSENNVQNKFTPAPQKSRTPTPSPTVQSDETIRVSISKLDALMAQFSELLGAKVRAEQRLTEARHLQSFAADWQKKWMTLREPYRRLMRNGYNNNPDNKRHNNQQNKRNLDKDIATLVEFSAHNQEQLRNFNAQSNTLYRELSNDTMRFSLIIDELQEEIKRMRMLPLSTITTSFGRMVRDLARERDKQITLTIIGAETELDKRVLEQIKDPIIHLLRNAADHGLEIAAERLVEGKPANGQITLSASQQGNNIVIKVSDDGRGLDLPAIQMAAVRKGLLNQAEAEKLSDDEVSRLIFQSGFSSTKIITDISGRGVGLDVVRQNVEELHGTLNTSFEAGLGTTFTLTLPLTLASSRGLLVKAGEQLFAIPLTTVERMLQIDHKSIVAVEGKEAITYQDKPLALVRLVDLLELPHSTKDNKTLTVVIVSVAEKRMGLIVDSLDGEQEIVMKNLGRQLVKVVGIAGASILGSGQVILVLHTADLIRLASRTQVRSQHVTTNTDTQETSQQKTILIVDDSITTRTLEKNILETVGYQVQVATNGEEALATLATDDLPDLIVSDIAMPRLDGIELTRRVKQDDRYSDIPVILVTSLDSPMDKAQGIEVGADAYIVKSSFDQGNLLDTIEQLI